MNVFDNPPTNTSPAIRAGGIFTIYWMLWFRKLVDGLNGQAATVAALEGQLAGGISATIVTAKLTTGGTTGSMTFVDGVLTAQTAAT